MSDAIEKISKIRLLPVVAIEDAKKSNDLADALVAGGLPCAEITFRTAAAADSIKAMAARGDILVGAGTVLSVDQVKKAVDFGAKFIVSPGFDPEVVSYCVENNITVTPGVATPSEVGAALKFGLDVLKFFPAEANGGLKAIKAISAPFGDVKFIPTGGINAKNICEYLAFPKIVACGGSWMVSSALINEGKFDEIKAMVAEAVALVKNS